MLPSPSLEHKLTQLMASLERLNPATAALLAAGLLLAAISIWAATGFYQVHPGEAAVTLRFGQLCDRIVGPCGEGPEAGMNRTSELKWWWPGPIGSKYIERVDLVRRLEVGFRSSEPGAVPIPWEGLMITGDLSIVDLQIVVQYRVHDLTGFLFSMDDPGEPERGVPHGRADGQTLRNAVESTLRHLVGQRSMDDLLYGDRVAMQEATRERLQQVLDGYGAGIQVEGVLLFQVGPPEPARAAFDQFLQARQGQAAPIGWDREQATELVALARDQADEMVAAAEAARSQRLSQADEETARFVSLLREYHRETDPARRQGYLEDMEALLPGVAAFIAPLESTP